LATAAWVAWFHGWGRLDLPISHVRGSDWDYQLTLLEATARIWSVGELPVWNPWTAGGVPLWANPEAPVLHPIAGAAMVWHPATVARVVLISHMAIQVMGTALLAKMMGARWWALPMVAVGLLTTDVLVWRMAHGHLMMAQAAWIPWAMVFVFGIREPFRAGAAAAGVIAIAVHGGGHYPAWIALAATGIWVGIRTAQQAAASTGIGRARSLLDGVVRLASVGLFTGLLTAPRWWITASALAETPRLRGPQAPIAMGDFNLIEGFVMMFGSGWLPHPAAPGIHEGLPSLGTPLLLALAIAGLARSRTTTDPFRLAGTGAVAAAVYLAVSFGHNFPGNAFAGLHSFSPLDRFRNPERWAMAWVPLLAALSTVGITRLVTTSRRTSLRATTGLGLGLLIVAHTWVSMEPTRLNSTIDQITLDTYERQPRTLPIAIREPNATNFETTGRNESCLACSDALLHEAPPMLPEGPFELDRSADLLHWQPDLVRFVVPVDPKADPREPMVSTVLVPQAFRSGWSAEDETGLALKVTADRAGTRVRVPTPGRVVELRYQPPGWTRATQLGIVGGIFWLAVLAGMRVRLLPRRDPAH
ncbi:MAG TPA: hypothetical protein DFR83_16475, partial [Deltaproteobacteria bacterium]|nr:hypothetical protein [Deltaproteobacteria bacterium]